ncbi:MAG: tape measure protein, partial [Peptoanaerobacter stomatis]|uniref:tape measure protein n=1 Tax=Peptoanaerobacter stomatis TaxID=796937 RepID=UPI003F9F7274
MAGIRTSLALVNGASHQLRRINTDIEEIIDNTNRARYENDRMFNGNSFNQYNLNMQQIINNYNIMNNTINNNTNGQERLNDSIKKTDRNANNLVNTMRRLLSVYIGISGLKKILSVSDDLSQTHSRINLMNDGLQTTAELEEKIMKSANRSRAAYSDTAKVISKLGITASKSFKNNDEIIAFTELMNKSFKLGGASASEQANGMYQLTQAMASGRLQGDEFRSIIENAPLLAKAIADYTGVGQQGLKKMSSEGLITADIIKGALFSSANEIEERYKQMPITFSDIWNRIKNGSIAAFRPFLNKFSEIANSDKFSSAISGLINLLALLGMVLANVINIAVSGASFIYDNWSIIEPIFLAIISIIGLYTSVTIAQSIATSALAFAQWALNSAILSYPLFWIIAGILAVIVIIAVLIHKTIGFKLAWLQTVNFIIVVWDSLVIAGHMMANGVCDAWDNILIGIKMVSTGIINAISIMKSTGLMILQDFINGAIDLINKLINSVNKIVDTGIGTINHVTFATEAVIQTRYENAKRDEELNSYISEKRNNMQRRADKIKQMEK